MHHTISIPLPIRFDDESAIAFVNAIGPYNDYDEIVFDFKQVAWVRPFPTLVIALAIRRMVRFRKKHRLSTSLTGHDNPFAASAYLKHFGFFRFIGLDIGKAPDEAPGGATYQPIRVVTRAAIESSARGQPIQEEIDRRSDELSEVIYPFDINPGPAMMVSYALREIMRNVFEHAQTAECFVMAQRWYSGEAEIVIADEGIGIHRSLNTVFGQLSPKEAVEKCLLPGITSRDVKETGSEWDNSGFGLYVVSELGRRFGSFSIISSEIAIRQNNGARHLERIDLPSTVVKLCVDTKDADYFPNILSEIVARGEQAAGHIPGAIVTASKASKSFNRQR